ncbi:hypothetical protein C8F01DRAFT_1370035 [Mycena amicta]|nr:hypothetical protein C8F01DRAFT_1370035 [Mycena amicta]
MPSRYLAARGKLIAATAVAAVILRLAPHLSHLRAIHAIKVFLPSDSPIQEPVMREPSSEKPRLPVWFWRSPFRKSYGATLPESGENAGDGFPLPFPLDLILFDSSSATCYFKLQLSLQVVVVVRPAILVLASS